MKAIKIIIRVIVCAFGIVLITASPFFIWEKGKDIPLQSWGWAVMMVLALVGIVAIVHWAFKD